MKKIEKYNKIKFKNIAITALLAVVFASTLAMTISAEDNTCPACLERPTPTGEVAKEAVEVSLAPGYCPSSGGSPLYEYMSSVTYTQNPGGTITITVDIYIANPTGCTYGESCPEYDNSPEYINAWIDWDGDKIWESSERVMDEALTGYVNINYQGTMTASKIVTIPQNAVNFTWMRVNLGWGHDPNDPCEYSWTWGDVVDKEVMVRPEIEVRGGLSQYKDEFKDKVFRRNDDKPRFEVKAILQDGEEVKVDIFRGGANPIKTLDTIKKSEKIYEAVWDDWTSSEWANIPDEIPVGKYKARAKVMKGGSELTSSDKKEFYVIFDYNTGDGFVESKNAFAVDFDNKNVGYTYPINQYNSQKFKTALNIVDGQTQVRQASTLISTYTHGHPSQNWACRHYTYHMIEYCRAVAIPARFLWGYGDWNDGEGIATYQFKKIFNHALVEVKDKKDGWIHYDPTGWGDDNQFGSDEYAKIGAEFRPDIPGSGYWVSAAPKISNTGIIGTENVYDRYTFCSDGTSIIFLNPPYDYGQNMQFSVTVKNNGAIPINTPVHVRLFDVPSILSLGVAHQIDDVIIANSLNSGQTATKQFSWILPDFGLLNSFYEAIGDRDVKVVVYYKASRAGNVEIETDVLSARVPGLCISPIQTITVDGEERSLTNATFTYLNQTTEKSWRKETYISDVPSIVTIYTETEKGENYSKAIVSIENPDSVEHNYSFLVQLAGEGDAIFMPSLGSVTTNLTGLNVSTDYFVTYLQANGTNNNVSIYKFSKNATIESIELLKYEGITGVFVNVTWNQTLRMESLQDFLIYFSKRNGSGLNFSEIHRILVEEIVENGDSLVNIGIVTPTQCRVGDVQPINITLFNNGVKNETITTTLNITKIISNIPHTTLSLYNDTATVTVPLQTEQIVTFMVPVSEYTKSGLWDINVANNKGIRAKTVVMIEDAFDLNCTQNITVEQYSEFTFNATIANTWDTTVHSVNATIELVDYFNTSDPIELSLGDLLHNENITITWQLNATSSGLLPIEVRVTSDDGGYDIVDTTVTSLSQPSLWIPNVIKTTSPPDIGAKTAPINITIYNIGDLNATNVSVEIIPPENVTATNITWNIDELIGDENVTCHTNITFTKPEDFIIDVFASDDADHNASGVIYVHILSNLSANFNDTYSDYGLDSNSDGMYNYLMIEVGVNVASAGIGNVEGWLCDSNGTEIVKAENSSYLFPGNYSVILKFDGFDIYKHGVNGPYDLRDLKLYNESGVLIDSRNYAYTTSAYSYMDFEKPLIYLTGNYSDDGTDIDGNGLFNNLTVNVEVMLASEGHVVINARLVDKNGEEIVWASNTSLLSANLPQIIQINFDGLSINKHGVDGPYYLKDVYVYHTGDPTQPDYVCDAYTTNVYRYTDFEFPTSVNTSTGTGTAYFASDAGSIEDLVALNESGLPEENPNVDFPQGLFSFNITGLNPNQTVNITIAFPQDIPTTAQYWKYGPNGSINNPQPERWYQIPIGSNDGDNIITIKLTDGGIGDDDGIANGVIVDQGGPGVSAIISTTVDFDPDTLNKKSEGKWVTVYTELPAGYNVTDINVSTMMLNETVPAELHPTEVGDYDSDGIPDLMVKFDRQAVIDMLPVGDAVNVTVTGKLYDGTPFEGSDTIRVMD